MTTNTVPVLIGACLCPGAPHEDGDFVYLRAKLGLAAGVVIQRLMIEANQKRADSLEITGKLAEAYLTHGVESWTLHNEQGPIPVTPESIAEHLLNDFERFFFDDEETNEIYTGPVLSPLVNRVAALSSSTSSNGSTSAAQGDGRYGDELAGSNDREVVQR